MKVKVVITDHHPKLLIVLREEGDLFQFINQDGELAQINKNKLSIQSQRWTEVEDAYRLIPDKDKHTPSLETLLEFRSAVEKERIESYLKTPLSPHNGSHICFGGGRDDQELRLVMYRAPFDIHFHGCEIEVYDHHLSYLKEGEHKMVVLVLEEFGTFYLNGASLLGYLGRCPHRKKLGKKLWTLSLDYEKFLRVRGQENFYDFSNNINYLRGIIAKSADGSPAENVVELSAVRDIRDMFRKIKEKKAGPSPVAEPKKLKESS